MFIYRTFKRLQMNRTKYFHWKDNYFRPKDNFIISLICHQIHSVRKYILQNEVFYNVIPKTNQQETMFLKKSYFINQINTINLHSYESFYRIGKFQFFIVTIILIDLRLFQVFSCGRDAFMPQCILIVTITNDFTNKISYFETKYVKMIRKSDVWSYI